MLSFWGAGVLRCSSNLGSPCTQSNSQPSQRRRLGGSRLLLARAHGTEAEFGLEQAGRLRLIAAKWTENLSNKRLLAPMTKVAEMLGRRGAAEHWIACRTPHSHLLADHPNFRVIDGYRFEDWLGPA